MEEKYHTGKSTESSQQLLPGTNSAPPTAKTAEEWMLGDGAWSSPLAYCCCLCLCKKKVEKSWEVLNKNWPQAASRPKRRSSSFGTEEECIDEDQVGMYDVEDLVVGPAVIWAWISNIITWAGFGLISLFSAFYTSVDPETGIAKSLYSSSIGFIIILCSWVVTTLLPLLFEFLVALHIIPAQVSVMGQPSLFGYKLSFMRYLLFLLTVSLVLHTDIFTTAMFVGRTFKSTHSCQGGIDAWGFWWFVNPDPETPLEALPPLEALWRESAAKSPILTRLGLERITFWQWTLVSWMMMLFQFVYALLYSVPVSPDFRNEYSRKRFTWCAFRCCRRYQFVEGQFVYEDAKSQQGPHDRRRALYHTAVAAFTTHGRCLQALADSGRMMSVQWFDDDYCERASEEWKLDKILLQMQRANWRFFVFAMQAIMLPSLQITFYKAQEIQAYNAQHVRHDQQGGAWMTDFSTFLSVCLSVLFGIKYVVWEIKTLYRAKVRFFAAKERNETEVADTRHTLMKYQIQQRSRSARMTLLISAILTLMVALYFTFMLVKGFMEIFWCPADTGLWDVPATWNLTDGCLKEKVSHNGTVWTGNWSTDICFTNVEYYANLGT